MTRTQLRQSRAPGGRPSRHLTHDVWQRGLAAPLRSVEKPVSLAGSTEVPPLVKVNSFVTPFCWITSAISLYARKSWIPKELSLFKHHITAHRVSSQPVLHPLVAMQRIADYVGRHGYHWWTSGFVDVKRLPRLQAKFETQYGIALHRNTRSRHKRSGKGAAVFMCYREPNPTSQCDVDASCRWVLLVAFGDHPAFDLETLSDARTDRGRFHFGPYELVRATRPGSANPVWCYRMSKAHSEAYRARVIRCARGDPNEPVDAVLRSLHAEPGWRPVRVEIGHLMALLRREWRRRRGHRAPLPTLTRLPYVQRLPNQMSYSRRG